MSLEVHIDSRRQVLGRCRAAIRRNLKADLRSPAATHTTGSNHRPSHELTRKQQQVYATNFNAPCSLPVARIGLGPFSTTEPRSRLNTNHLQPVRQAVSIKACARSIHCSSPRMTGATQALSLSLQSTFS